MCKKAAIIAGGLLAIFLTVFYVISEINSTPKIPNTISQWRSKYPSVFSNSIYIKLIDPQPYKINESQVELSSAATNPFGVRDDVLEYVFTFINESNYQGRLAAIKRAKLDQSEIGITDSAVLNAIENQASAAVYCLNLPLLDSKEFILGYDALLRNTSKRLQEQDRIEHILSGYVISPDFGIANGDLNFKCRYFLGLDR
jgi:hypothetical protein